MFYTLYCELCEDKNMTPGGAAAAIGFNRATVTTWKNTGKAPKGELLTKISKYFEVPVDFLLERPPFDHWPQINADRRGFLSAAGTDEDLLQMVWGIDALDPYAAKMKDFISYVNLTILSAVPKEGGGWDIIERPLSPHKKAPTLTPKDERKVARNENEEDMLLLARHMEPIPEEDRKILKDQFKNSIDLYLKARGLNTQEDK